MYFLKWTYSSYFRHAFVNILKTAKKERRHQLEAPTWLTFWGKCLLTCFLRRVLIVPLSPAPFNVHIHLFISSWRFSVEYHSPLKKKSRLREYLIPSLGPRKVQIICDVLLAKSRKLSEGWRDRWVRNDVLEMMKWCTSSECHSFLMLIIWESKGKQWM